MNLDENLARAICEEKKRLTEQVNRIIEGSLEDYEHYFVYETDRVCIHIKIGNSTHGMSNKYFRGYFINYGKNFEYDCSIWPFGTMWHPSTKERLKDFIV